MKDKKHDDKLLAIAFSYTGILIILIYLVIINNL